MLTHHDACYLQVRQVGKEFYNTDIKVELLHVGASHGRSDVQMKLSFDNTEGYAANLQEFEADSTNLPITSDQFFNLFPFYMVLDRCVCLP